MILALGVGLVQKNPLDVTYYTVPARNAPIMVTITRKGEGKVWNIAAEPRLVSTFKIAPASSNKDELLRGYTFTTLSSPDGKLAMILDPGFTRWFRVVRLNPFKELWRRGDIDAQLTQSVWSEDGKKLVVPNRKQPRASWLFDATKGKLLGQVPIADPLVASKSRAYGMSGMFMNGSIVGVDLRSRRTVLKIVDPTTSWPFKLSPDGKYLVVGAHSGPHYRYRIWRTRDGRKMGEFAGEGVSWNHPLDPIFPDVHRLALLKLGEIRSLPNGRLIRRIKPFQENVGTEGVYIRDPKNPLRPRYVDPK